MNIYIVAKVSEDGYIEVDACFREYEAADNRATKLMELSDDEWEVISSNLVDIK